MFSVAKLLWYDFFKKFPTKIQYSFFLVFDSSQLVLSSLFQGKSESLWSCFVSFSVFLLPLIYPCEFYTNLFLQEKFSLVNYILSHRMRLILLRFVPLFVQLTLILICCIRLLVTCVVYTDIGSFMNWNETNDGMGKLFGAKLPR